MPSDVSVGVASLQIEQAACLQQITAIRALLKKYADWLGIDLCFQGFVEELAALPGAYSPPCGRLLLASDAREAAGCVALRPLDHAMCEMKRLYVRPEHRGRGLGRSLAEHVIREAKTIGYRAMVLDTLPLMDSAIRLYDSLGFRPRKAYYDTPLEQTVFMQLDL